VNEEVAGAGWRGLRLEIECITGSIVVPQRGTRFVGVVGIADASVRKARTVEVMEIIVSILSGWNVLLIKWNVLGQMTL
jgi:hypothetical protein